MAENDSRTQKQETPERPSVPQYDRFGFLKSHEPKGSAVGRDLRNSHWTRPWTSPDEKAK